MNRRDRADGLAETLALSARDFQGAALQMRDNAVRGHLRRSRDFTRDKDIARPAVQHDIGMENATAGAVVDIVKVHRALLN